jgi:hypothetical protein
MAKYKSDNESIQADLDGIFYGGLLGALFSIVAGGKAGAMIAARCVEGGAFANVLGLIGALLGAIIAAPLGLLVGCILGYLLRQLFDLFSLIALIPLTLLRDWLRDRRPRIGSFVASPNPVTAGNELALTGSKITATNSVATIHEVAFYAQINDTKTLLGYGTQTGSDAWTLNLTVSLSPGSYTLLARACDSFKRSSRPRRLILTVQ